jgi:hypothetical protein
MNAITRRSISQSQTPEEFALNTLEKKRRDFYQGPVFHSGMVGMLAPLQQQERCCSL